MVRSILGALVYDDYGSADKSATALYHANEGVHNTRGNVLGIYQTLCIQATNGSRENLEKIYHSYTYWREPYDNHGSHSYVYYLLWDGRSQGILFSDASYIRVLRNDNPGTMY